MKLARLGLSSVMGIAVAAGLLVLMYKLIETGEVVLDEKDTTPLANIWQEDEVIEDNLKKLNPKKPEPKEPPPPRMPQESMDVEEVTMVVQMKAPKMDAKLNIGAGGFGGGGDARPIKRVRPRYPQRALERGMEGYATVEFTITTSGTVINPEVIEGMQKTKSGGYKPTAVFNAAAKKAAKRLKYKPKMVDGVAVEMIQVYKFTFELEQEGK